MRKFLMPAGTPANNLDALKIVEENTPRPGRGEVLIRIHAASINFRDRVFGNYTPNPLPVDVVPLSDGSGVVEGVGEGVTQFKAGDKVSSTFFMNWVDGIPRGPTQALGSPNAPGMLADYVVLPEDGVIPMARNLSFEEASCLPCAGVTAWNGLVNGVAPLKPGQTVLLLGTGGVSILALQIAAAAGANITITSSSDDKLERAKALGAKHGVNYKVREDWHAAATETAGITGFDKVVEVGGFGTLPQSMQAVGMAGEIAMIGVMTRGGDNTPHILMFKGASLRGIMVGSKAMALDLNRAVEANDIHPVIDKVFPFADAADAFRYQMGPDLFGKVVISMG